MAFDLMTTVEYGGCSAKLPAARLSEALSVLPKPSHPDLLVDIETHDDAGVFRIAPDRALILTVDFFPPICSDPYQFGRIAAANALSDVYAMGGKVLTALNIVAFPASRIPLEALSEILRGGQDKVTEAGGVIAGGHTIDDYPPKYGLSVTGEVHPGRITTNAGARPGDRLILTKPLGTGTIVAGKRIEEIGNREYEGALLTMDTLNKAGAEIMSRHGVRCATDVTGFGLLGHALKMADASEVTMAIDTDLLPLLPGAYDLADLGCIPGGCFRNQEFVDQSTRFAEGIDYNKKMLALDPQTSGGLLMSVEASVAQAVVKDLQESGYQSSTIIGEVLERAEVLLEVG